MLSPSQDKPHLQIKNSSYGSYLLGIMCALIAALGCSGIAIVTREIKEVHFSIMMFWYGIFAASIYFTTLLAEYQLSAKYDFIDETYPGFRLLCYNFHQWTLMLSAVFCNAVSMNCSTIAFQYEKSAFISSIMLIESVYAFIIDIVWFKTTFVTLEVLGVLVVVALNIANVCNKI